MNGKKQRIKDITNKMIIAKRMIEKERMRQTEEGAALRDIKNLNMIIDRIGHDIDLISGTKK